MPRLYLFVSLLFVGWFCTICTESAHLHGSGVVADMVPGIWDADPVRDSARRDSAWLPSFLPDTVWVGMHEPGIGFILAEDSLRVMARELVQPAEDSLRLANSDRFMAFLKEVTGREGAMAYAFDSLATVSVLVPPDSSFRIITWYVPLSQQRFRYFGLVQTGAQLSGGVAAVSTGEVVNDHTGNTGNGFKVADTNVRSGAADDATTALNRVAAGEPSHENVRIIQLVEHIDTGEEPGDRVFTHDAWYGTWYYDLVSKQHGDEISYVLLGWRADRPDTRKRIIEPLSFRSGKPVFGAPVFELAAPQTSPAGLAARTSPGMTARRPRPPGGIMQPEPLSLVEHPLRIIFEYSVRVTMGLLYDTQSPRPGAPTEPMIVFDRLAPLDEEHRGNRAFYVPEGNIFDAFLFREGRWELARDVDARVK